MSRTIDRCTAEELSGALYSAGVDMDALFSRPVTVVELRKAYRDLLGRQLKEWKAAHDTNVPPHGRSPVSRLAKAIKSFYL